MKVRTMIKIQRNVEVEKARDLRIEAISQHALSVLKDKCLIQRLLNECQREKTKNLS